MQQHKAKIGLLARLLIGIIVGILLGSLGEWLDIQEHILFTGFVRLYTTFTTLFAEFLSFIIPLLIVSFVSIGLADLGKKANKLFGITLLLAYSSTVFAGFLAFFTGKAVLPQLISEITGSEITANSFAPLFEITAQPVFGVMTALILAFVIGLGMANSNSDKLSGCIRDLQEIITKVLTKVIIPLIPVYVAGLFCKIAAEGELFPTIKMFIKLYAMILVFQWLYIAIQFTISSILTKENQFKKLRNISPAYFTALGTQSSATTIPVNLEAAKKNKVKSDVADFVIPLCATIHLAGDTICLVIGAMGILIANGLTPTIGMFAPFILMLGVTMVAAPGVPGGGVMAALGLITSMLGFTDTMQQLIISLHFSQDSFGTACNITGDQAIAFIVNTVDSKVHAKENED